jgi:hypothetical protein
MPKTTGIGSLPFSSIREAVEYSLRHDIPFLPELPLRGDSMLDYIKNPGHLSCLEEFAQATSGAELIKLQCIGPATLISAGYPEDEAIQRCYDHISALLALVQADSTILFLDEPSVGHVGFDYLPMWQALFDSFQVIPGTHICSNADWDKIFESHLEILSFDASQYNITQYPKYPQRKRIAWGITSIEDVADPRQGDIITAPCGINPKLYTPEDAYSIQETLAGISNHFQQ